MIGLGRDDHLDFRSGDPSPVSTQHGIQRTLVVPDAFYFPCVVCGDHPDVLPPPEARTRKYKAAWPDRLRRVASLRLNLCDLQFPNPSLTCSWYLLAPVTSFQSNSTRNEPPRSGKLRTTVGALGAARDAGVAVGAGSGVGVGVAVAVGLGGSDVGIGGAGVGVVVGPGVAVGRGVAVAVGVGDGIRVGAGVGVRVGDGVGVGVLVTPGVGVGVGVGALVSMWVWVWVSR